MKRRTLFAVVSAIALLVAVLWLVARHRSDGAVPAGAAASVAEAPDAISARSAALESTPQAHAYRERLAFERRIKDFLGAASRLGAVDRSERARAFAATVDAYERAGQMSAGEAFLLHAALVEAGATDEAEQAQRLARLVERYRADAAQREAAWAMNLQRDPRFRSYKSREREIVAEVMAMRDIPGGLTRDEYLRERLQEARERLYR